jgi:hypothetical protein
MIDSVTFSCALLDEHPVVIEPGLRALPGFQWIEGSGSSQIMGGETDGSGCLVFE